MKFYFGVISFALSLLIFSGAVLSWDGSYQFFTVLDSQAPFVIQNRFIVLPMQWTVLLAAKLTDNLVILQTVYGFAYALIPLGTLAISWLIVRHTAPSLFVWAAMGIGIGTLAGQFFVVSEAILAVQLFWPIVLSIITRLQKRNTPVVILLLAVLFVAHPFSIILFVLAAAISFVVGWFQASDRRRMWSWALLFLAVAVVAVLRFSSTQSKYEADQISVDVVLSYFRASVAGLPLVALICSWFASMMVFVGPLLRKFERRDLAYVVNLFELVCLLISCAAMMVWAGNPDRWAYALGYRYWALFCTLPYVGLGVLEGLRHGPSSLDAISAEWPHRKRTVQLVGLVFLFVIAHQSLTWLDITRQFREAIAQSPAACVPTSSLEWINTTPLNHWSITSYSIVLQGRVPEKVVFASNDCLVGGVLGGLQLADWDLRDWNAGWFNLHQLAKRLGADETAH